MPLIRPSTDADIAAITGIYRHHVLHGTGTVEIDPPTEVDMQARRADVLSKGLPYLVLEDAGEVAGFAYCNWFKPRPAYRFSAEDSLYLSPQAAGKGWGRMLLTELMSGRGGNITAGEVGLPIQRDGKVLPCGIYGRWEA